MCVALPVQPSTDQSRNYNAFSPRRIAEAERRHFLLHVKKINLPGTSDLKSGVCGMRWADHLRHASLFASTTTIARVLSRPEHGIDP